MSAKPGDEVAPLSTDASACPTEGFLRSSLNQNSSPPSAGDAEPVAALQRAVDYITSPLRLSDDNAESERRKTIAKEAQEAIDTLRAPAEGLREALERLTADVRDGDYRRVLIAKDNDLVWCTATWKDVETVRAALSPTKATGAES